MSHAHTSNGRGGSVRRAANLSIDADLLRRARALGINLSQTLEERLIQVVAEHEREQWLESNREALGAYNERVERDGTFSEGLRRF